MKQFIAAVFLLFISIQAIAQNKTANSIEYKTAVGVKLWDGGGLTLKTFIQEERALEFIGFFNGNGTRITGLYQFHGDLNTEGNLKWYLGGGGHVGLYKLNTTIIGIDGVIGIDYKFNNMPLNLALDWQPSFEFNRNYLFSGNWGGLAVRYTL